MRVTGAVLYDTSKGEHERQPSGLPLVMLMSRKRELRRPYLFGPHPFYRKRHRRMDGK